jgi:light-harvesting protein B-800-850 alpha chain
MFQDVLNYKPAEQDYRIWLVVNPSTWLMPMMLSLLVLGIAVHAAVFSIAPAGMLFVNDEAPVAAAPAAAAPAPAAEAAPAAE